MRVGDRVFCVKTYRYAVDNVDVGLASVVVYMGNVISYDSWKACVAVYPNRGVAKTEIMFFELDMVFELEEDAKDAARRVRGEK